MTTNDKTLMMMLVWLTTIIIGCCYVKSDWMSTFTRLRSIQNSYVDGMSSDGDTTDGKPWLRSGGEGREHAEFADPEQPDLETHLLDETPKADEKRKVLPQVIIAGVKKSGTGALQTFLGIHSQLAVARDEQHFFEIDYNYEKGLEWYRQGMPDSLPNQLTLEKTPKYFVTEKAVQRIHEMNSSIRIIFIVREPTFRMVSDYLHQHWYHPGSRPERTFEQLAINATTGALNEDSEELRTSIYHVHFRKWLKYFNRSQILVIDGESFARNPVSELVNVERFLGLENQFTVSKFKWNLGRGVYCIRKAQREECLGREKGRPHPRVDQNVWNELCQYFKPNNELFFAMIGQRFDWPCSQRAAIF